MPSGSMDMLRAQMAVQNVDSLASPGLGLSSLDERLTYFGSGAAADSRTSPIVTEPARHPMSRHVTPAPAPLSIINPFHCMPVCWDSIKLYFKRSVL
jgi:hypothetical protein